LADQLRNHVSGAEDTDVWVRQVGMAFKLADEQALLFGQIGQTAVKYGSIIAGGVSNRQMLGEWADQLRDLWKYATTLVGVAVLAPAIRLGPKGILIFDAPDLITRFHHGGGVVRKWIDLSPKLTTIGRETLPGHMLKFGLGAVPAAIGIKALIDLLKYGWGTKFVSATIVDTGIILAGVAAGAAIAAFLLALPLSIPAGIVLGAGVIGGIIMEVALEWTMRDNLINRVDSVVQPIAGALGNAVQQVGNITGSTVTSIVQRVPGAAQAVRNITQTTVQAISGASVAAQAVRNTTQAMVQAVATGVWETTIDVNLGALATVQAIFSPLVSSPALQPL